MTERRPEILLHHSIRAMQSIREAGKVGLSPTEYVQNQWADWMADEDRWRELQKHYPALQDDNQRDRIIEANLTTLKAIESGFYSIIPEFDLLGRKNRDMSCEACGRDQGQGVCLVQEQPYDEKVFTETYLLGYWAYLTLMRFWEDTT